MDLSVGAQMADKTNPCSEVSPVVRTGTGLEFVKFRRAMTNRKKKMEETGCEIISGAPATLAVTG